jgi:hypothetical protein
MKIIIGVMDASPGTDADTSQIEILLKLLESNNSWYDYA